MEVEIKDNSGKVLDAFEKAVLRGLERVGMAGEGYAKDLCPVYTGNLRNSISHAVDDSEKEAYIGTNVEYAAPVELGTSKQKAQPYLKPAASDHTQTYKNIMVDEIKNG